MIPEALPWLVCETGLLVPKRRCSKDPEYHSEHGMPEGSQLSERCCIGDPAFYQGALSSESAIRLLVHVLRS